MNDLHWAVFALRDIQNALEEEKYEIAAYHIDDAINAILAVGEDCADYAAATRRADEKGIVYRL
jgi:hypothetical protein